MRADKVDSFDVNGSFVVVILAANKIFVTSFFLLAITIRLSVCPLTHQKKTHFLVPCSGPEFHRAERRLCGSPLLPDCSRYGA
jgi:hypothetical protein